MGLSWLFGNDDERTLMVDTKLPFGSRKACKIFTSISDSVSRIMKRKGATVINYIDDLLVIADTRSKCWLDLDNLVNLLTRLGLEINWDKFIPPTQCLDFLGVKIDTLNRTLALPPGKYSEFVDLVDLWTKKKRVSKKELLSFVGKLNWACKVVRGGRTFLRRLIDLSCSLKANHHRTWLNLEAREDIKWWVNGLKFFHGYTNFIGDLLPPHSEFVTDACHKGGGGLYEHDWFYVDFEADFPEYSNAHINCLELLTVLVGVRRWGHLWSGHHIRVKCDNMSSVFAIKKGSSRSPVFMRILRELFWLSTLFNFRLTATHIKGEHNTVADIISRLHMPMFQQKLLCMLGGGGINCLSNMSAKSFISLQGFTRK